MEICFPTVIGNDKLKRRLAAEIENDRFPHAYILAGRDGSGKMTIAMQIAAALACKNKHTLPCGECDSCRKILGGFSPDVFVIRKEADKKEFSVGLIREIRDGLYIAPNELDKRVYILEHTELMNASAQNAFLKMLEEPPHYAVFLLLCSNVAGLLDTIKSRAPILYTEALPQSDVRAYLLEHSPRAREMAASDPEKLASVLLSAGGSIGEAMFLCEDAEKYNAARELTYTVLDALTAPAAAGLGLLCDTLPMQSDALCEWLGMLQRAFRDVAVLQKAPDAAPLFFESRDRAETYTMKITVAKAISVIEAIDRLLADLRLNMDARLAAVSLMDDMRSIMMN